MSIIEIAKDCGALDIGGLRHMTAFTELQLTALAVRIRNEEREACAKACEAERVEPAILDGEPNEGDRAYNLATEHCASAIRSRGESLEA